jgi:hypothetical protein
VFVLAKFLYIFPVSLMLGKNNIETAFSGKSKIRLEAPLEGTPQGLSSSLTRKY